MTKFKLYIYSIILISTLFNTGCYFSSKRNESENKYSFDNIQLTSTNTKGKTAWNILSPQARFERDYNIVRAKESIITIYRGNYPKFEIRGDSLTSLNDLDLVVIEGKISITTLQRNTAAQKKVRRKRLSTTDNYDLGIYKGDSLTWDVLNNKIIIHEYPNNFKTNPVDNITKYICYIDSGCRLIM